MGTNLRGILSHVFTRLLLRLWFCYSCVPTQQCASCLSSDCIDAWWLVISSAYSEPTRFYHTLEHIYQLLQVSIIIIDQ